MIEPLSMRSAAGDDESDRARAALGEGFAGLAALLVEHCARTQVPLAVKDLVSGRWAWANAAMAALLDRPADAVVGQEEAALLPGVSASALRSAEQAALLQPRGVLTEHRLAGADGARDFAVLRMPLRAPGKAEVRYLAALWQDIGTARLREARLATTLAQLEAAQREAESLRRERQDATLHDASTGLCRGTLFDELMRREIDLSSREHREFALVLVALDVPRGAAGFDAEARERVFAALGRQLRSRTRAMDASCRLGDQRFAVLLSGVGLATAHARMEGLRRQCAEQIVAHAGRDLGFTVSMGVASFPHTADTQEPLVAAAEQALAEAERRGGNQVALASIRFEDG